MRHIFLRLTLSLLVVLFTGCGADVKKITEFESFQASISILGQCSFEAELTEEWIEFSSDALPMPVRYENGVLSLLEQSFEPEQNDDALFHLPELFSSILSSAENTLSFKGMDAHVETDAASGLPATVFWNGYTITVNNISINQGRTQ